MNFLNILLDSTPKKTIKDIKLKNKKNDLLFEDYLMKNLGNSKHFFKEKKEPKNSLSDRSIFMKDLFYLEKNNKKDIAFLKNKEFLKHEDLEKKVDDKVFLNIQKFIENSILSSSKKGFKKNINFGDLDKPLFKNIKDTFLIKSSFSKESKKDLENSKEVDFIITQERKGEIAIDNLLNKNKKIFFLLKDKKDLDQPIIFIDKKSINFKKSLLKPNQKNITFGFIGERGENLIFDEQKNIKNSFKISLGENFAKIQDTSFNNKELDKKRLNNNSKKGLFEEKEKDQKIYNTQLDIKNLNYSFKEPLLNIQNSLIKQNSNQKSYISNFKNIFKKITNESKSNTDFANYFNENLNSSTKIEVAKKSEILKNYQDITNENPYVLNKNIAINKDNKRAEKIKNYIEIYSSKEFKKVKDDFNRSDIKSLEKESITFLDNHSSKLHIKEVVSKEESFSKKSFENFTTTQNTNSFNQSPSNETQSNSQKGSFENFTHKENSEIKNNQPNIKNSFTFKIDDMIINATLKNKFLTISLNSNNPILITGALESEIRSILKEHGFKNFNLTIKDREKKLYLNSSVDGYEKRVRSKVDVKV